MPSTGKKKTAKKTVLGVTGGVGSGKSRILRMLKEEYGARIIEADRVCNRLIEPGGSCVGDVAALLGVDVIAPDGGVDKRKMSDRIFADPSLRLVVNDLLHPATVEAVRKEIGEAPESLIVYEAALPREGAMPEICEKILFVWASRKTRIARLAAGRGYSEAKSRSIMANQMPVKAYRALADAVLDNDGSPEETARRLHRRMARWGIGITL